jgi:hypothetical protein
MGETQYHDGCRSSPARGDGRVCDANGASYLYEGAGPPQLTIELVESGLHPMEVRRGGR